MLTCQEEVMMLMKQCPVKRNECLPLLVVQFDRGFFAGVLRVVHFDALVLDHDKTGVDTFDFSYQLLLAYGFCFGLFYENLWVVLRYLRRRCARRRCWR